MRSRVEAMAQKSVVALPSAHLHVLWPPFIVDHTNLRRLIERGDGFNLLGLAASGSTSSPDESVGV